MIKTNPASMITLLTVGVMIEKAFKTRLSAKRINPITRNFTFLSIVIRFISRKDSGYIEWEACLLGCNLRKIF